MKTQHIFWRLGASLAIFVFVAASYAQEGKVSEIIEKGIGQYKHENYDEAEITLKQARKENPKSTLAAYYLGLTYKQMQNYKKAVKNLRDAVTHSPKIKGALIELIDSLYQIGKLDEAKKWIKEAENEGIRPAQTAFLKGLVLLKDEDTQGAIAAFENAKELDKSMTQPCDYQIGMASLKARKYSDARRAFEQVVIEDPSSYMANFASEYMDAIEKKEEAAKPLKLSFGVAWQYDDNVILKPSDTALAANIADKADSREVYTGKAEFSKRLGDSFGLKAQYMMYIAKQNDLGFYDVFSNTVVLQPSIYLGNGFFTFPTSYNHTSVNDKAYLSTPSTSGIYSFMVGKSTMGQLYVKYRYKNYLWTPSTTDEDRDGNDLGFGLGWYFFYAKNKGYLNLRYGVNNEWTEGNNWEYTGNRFNATLLVPVLDPLKVTVSSDFFVQEFWHTNTVFDIKRRDRVFTVSSLVAYKIYKDSEIQFQYTYIRDRSNINVYEYSRNIFSVGLEVKF